VTVSHSGGATITVDAAGTVSVSALSKVAITAPAGMTIRAAQLQVDAGMANFSGVVRSSVLITGSVVSSAYTPGAGNIW
jgi:hypothetical protein